MKSIQKILCGLLIATVTCAAGQAAWGQFGAPASGAPAVSGTPLLTPIPANPGAPMAQSTFDPYALDANVAASAPSLYGTAPTASYGTWPSFGAINGYNSTMPTQVYSQPAPGFGATMPPALYPSNPYGAPPTGLTPVTNTLRLFQNLHFDHTFLAGQDGDDLQINDSFVSVTAALPNFFWSGQPLFISPGFGFHWWSGPFDGNPAHNLPANAYSAFLDLGWQSDINKPFGAELAGRIGVFSDFDTFISEESVRPSGVALLRLNLTPTIAIKGGVEYINRADIKIFPAGGVVWTPNPRTRWDIYFPQPKLASYLTTVGNHDVWGYLAGEYGGGVWTIDQGAPFGQTLFDINDIRVMLGVEFGAAGFTGIAKKGGFVEVGYVFERKLVFVTHPADNMSLPETFMLRGGLNF